MWENKRFLVLIMKADIYFSIVAEIDLHKKVGEIVKGHNLIERDEKGPIRRRSYSSRRHSMEYDDLGESILIFCQKSSLPNLSAFSRGVLSYIQVLIDTEEFKSLKIYLGKELLLMLSEKGFGIDIHHN